MAKLPDDELIEQYRKRMHEAFMSTPSVEHGDKLLVNAGESWDAIEPIIDEMIAAAEMSPEEAHTFKMFAAAKLFMMAQALQVKPS